MFHNFRFFSRIHRRWTLKSFVGIGNRVMACGSCSSKPLKTDKQPCFIHHLEHLRHPFIFRLQQISVTVPFFSE